MLNPFHQPHTIVKPHASTAGRGIRPAFVSTGQAQPGLLFPLAVHLIYWRRFSAASWFGAALWCKSSRSMSNHPICSLHLMWHHFFLVLNHLWTTLIAIVERSIFWQKKYQSHDLYDRKHKSHALLIHIIIPQELVGRANIPWISFNICNFFKIFIFTLFIIV